jgi:hypothetical protein
VPPQVVGQVVVWPQPLVAVYPPQWLPQAPALSGVQHVPLDRQNCDEEPHKVRLFGPQLTS